MTARTLKSAADLAEAGLIMPDRAAALARVADRYSVAITPYVAGLIDTSDIADPIARQFVPDIRELDARANENADPIGDKAHEPVKGVVRRYRDRALLKIVHVCPVYCRFCFRREMVGPDGEGGLSPSELDAALAYIAAEPDIWEVILTGGDPFMLSARRAAELMQRLAAIDHVKIVRWHTRVPVVDPARVTDEFVAALKSPRVATWVAIHANHPRELAPESRAAIARLADAGIPLVSQTVLLKGVNDDATTLEALMRGFVELRVKPYYLHHPDLAPGTAHFRTSIADGQRIVRDLRANASGLCQPAYVLDLPGGHSKTPIAASDIEDGACATPGRYRVRDDTGNWHDYHED